MNTNNNQKEEKGGFLGALSALFRGGSSAMGSGASQGLGAAGGLFASKAGIMGIVLGGATIAAGVGVVYNFIGSSSKPVYSPELFQNSFYEEESAAAGLKREQAKDRSSASASTLDMFSEQAKKDGLGGLASEAGGGEEGAASGEAAPGAEAASDGGSAAGGAPGAEGDGGAGARLQPSASFGSSRGSGGSSATAMPHLQSGGGLSSGIGGKFATMGLAGGKASAMSGAMAARVKSSPKYTAANFKRSGALSQGKFANKMSSKAAYSTGASMRNSAEEAFSGETTGVGDVEGGPAGEGMSGDGLSGGSKLKANDPNLNQNKYTVPEPKDTDIKDVSPWNDLYKKMFKFGAIAVAALIAAKIFGKLAKSTTPPWSGIWYGLALAACATVVTFAALIFAQAIKLMKGVSHNPPAEGDWAGQPATALPIMLVTIKLGIAAWDAACGLERGQDKMEIGKDGEPVTVKGADGKDLGRIDNPEYVKGGSMPKKIPSGGTVPGNSFMKPSMKSGNWGINDMFKFLK